MSPDFGSSNEPVNPPQTEIKPLDLNTRYSSARNEYNTRISARHTLISVQVVLVTALIGALFSSHGKTDLEDFRKTAALAIPIVLVLFGFFLATHDYILGILRNYMKAIEEKHSNDDLPGFYTNPSWGRKHDLARRAPAFALAAFAFLICFFVHREIDQLSLSMDFIFSVLSLIATILPVWTVWRSF